MLEIKTTTPLVLSTPFGNECPARLLASRYHDGDAIALLLASNDGIGEPLATITCNFPGISEKLSFGEIAVKNWSENEGMASWLFDNGLAAFTERAVQSGFVLAPIMTLAPEILTQITEGFQAKAN